MKAMPTTVWCWRAGIRCEMPDSAQGTSQ
jgi:hypothetical protein